jgi:hypothetical protein
MATAKKAEDLASQFAQSHAQGALAFMEEAGKFGKQAYRAAFDGTWQPIGPFSAESDTELSVLVKDLLTFAKREMADNASKFPGSFSDALTLVCRATAKGLHSHPGKYVHASSAAAWNVRPGEEVAPRLTSRTAINQRWLSAVFNHAPVTGRPARLFIVQFVHAGRITSVAELLAERNSTVLNAFTEADVTPEDVETMVGLFVAAFSNKSVPLELTLPQMLWPQPDSSYVALTALPALSVYNAIASMREHLEEEQRLLMSSYAVGSGQAQNISVAATSTSGHIRMLLCLPPQIRSTSASRLLRLAIGERLLVRLKKSDLASFQKDITALPNSAKNNFFRAHATVHAGVVLSRVLTLRDEIQADTSLVAKIPAELSSALKAVLLANPLTPLAKEIVDELVKCVLEAGAASVLTKHAEADVELYVKHLRAAITALV